uniref:Uncharacterized protein n=1 Tax=Cyanothece sp. (strain PCC 7425 / ATCC 29141) TaxID=395961 RepID=B8HP03_CYAP4
MARIDLPVWVQLLPQALPRLGCFLPGWAAWFPQRGDFQAVQR